MEVLFWLSLLFIVYTYVGYPILLFLWSILVHRRVRKYYPHDEPRVSVVIAARNEGKNIAGRIANLTSQQYPPGKLEIIIVSDGSTDNTAALVDELGKNRRSDHRIKLVVNDVTLGKPSSLNAGVNQAVGDIIVFADARQSFEPGAIRELVANFSDPQVGSVSGELIFRKQSDSSFKEEMNLYWNYEKGIRKMESRIHSVAGATGAVYAIRRSLYREIPGQVLIDDVLIPMRIVLQGFRNVFDAKALAFDTVSKDIAQEKKRKIRTLAGNYQLIMIMPELLNPLKNPIFFRFLSHKIFRLFVPYAFMVMVASSLAAGPFFYKLFFAAVLGLILLPSIEPWLGTGSGVRSACRLSRAVVSLNYFAMISLFKIIFPGREKMW
jgi:cellulose synthase/poly-beta-1,6-N-acetylglucosamine synthase-like glycosyltransferase